MITVKVEGTEKSKVLDKGEIYEMSLGSTKAYRENHKLTINKTEDYIKSRAEMMGDKVISIDIVED